MNYRHIVKAVHDQVWALLPATFETLVSIVEMRVNGQRFTAEEIRARIGAATRNGGARQHGSVAVLPLYGVLAQRMNQIDDVSGPGGTSTQLFAGEFRAAMDDQSIDTILIDVDSPGGSVYGVSELAEEIQRARGGDKRIVAIANSMAASAAYWIASQADEVVVTPGGEVGSIGVLTVHADLSKQMEGRGIRHTIISAGRYKTEGNPYEPLGDDARVYVQERVDRYYDMFVDAVAAGRGAEADAVRNGFGQGRMVLAAEAVEQGMADRVATFEQTLARLGGRRRATATSARADLRARRLRFA